MDYVLELTGYANKYKVWCGVEEAHGREGLENWSWWARLMMGLGIAWGSYGRYGAVDRGIRGKEEDRGRH